jgi:hypothetical protein
MERRLTMASTPIIRYYDHLRFVYEVESRMRELRNSTQNEGEGGDADNPPAQQKPAPGESKQAPTPRKDGGSRVDPPQQSGSPAQSPSRIDSSDFFEASLTSHSLTSGPRSAHSGGSAKAIRERSTIWTA